MTKPSFQKNNFNYGSWTKDRFSEAVTVTGPGKMIFLAGIGSEEAENGTILHKDDFVAQLRYAYSKLNNVLSRNGATLADVVKQVTYITDIRYHADVGRCRLEAYAGVPLPAHTMLCVSQLAHAGMLVEIDVTAVVPLDRGDSGLQYTVLSDLLPDVH